MKILVPLRRSSTFILAYFLCWQFSAHLAIAPDVSAFYPATGVLAFFIYRWGWRYLAVGAAAILLGCLPQVPFPDFSAANWLHALRQLAVYGGLALLARHYWKLTLPLETLHATMRLLAFALVSALLSSVLAMAIFWSYHPALREHLGSMVPGFWIGDFSGIVIFLGFVSISLALKQNTKRIPGSSRLAEIAPSVMSLVATSGLVVVLMVVLGTSSELHSYSYLILLPVIFGTVFFGLNFGIASAVLTNVSAVATYIFLDSGQMPVIQFQLLCAVVMCVAMVLGGAISDRAAARFDAWHDQLTALLNRRAFFEQGEMMRERAKRYHYSLALIMLDLDHFKLVNDTYGHDAGDRLLCEVADQCKEITRAGDLCARIGGEEFVLLIEQTDAHLAMQVAERLRTKICQLKRGSSQEAASASFGVSIFRGGNETLSDLLSSADRMLYVAKETGRNRVVVDDVLHPVSV